MIRVASAAHRSGDHQISVVVVCGLVDNSEKACSIMVIKTQIKSYLTNGAEQAQCDIGITTVKTSSHSLSHALNMKS